MSKIIDEENFKNNVEIILMVKQYPVLYDRTHEHYKNPNCKDEVWQEIAKKLGRTARLCKLKWYCLRRNYARVVETHFKYQYKEHLEFLGPHMRRAIKNKSLPKLSDRENKKIVRQFYSNLKFDEKKFQELDADHRMLFALKIRGIIKKAYIDQTKN